jgi:hypothetical protein
MLVPATAGWRVGVAVPSLPAPAAAVFSIIESAILVDRPFPAALTLSSVGCAHQRSC